MNNTLSDTIFPLLSLYLLPLINSYMRAREFISEDIPANPKQLDKSITAAVKGGLSIPGISINKSNGNPYQGYRFGIAMASAHSDKNKSEPTPAAGALAGDPLLSMFTQEEYDIVRNAAKAAMAGPVKKLSSMQSTETGDTNTASPVAKRKKNRYGV
jgi:hypothetical protein